MSNEDLVVFERLGEAQAVGVARLVREKPLNSLLLETIDQLAETIYAWLADDSIKCIVLDSSSDRAFCAGADITALYHSIKAADGGDNPYAEAFFLNEYRLDHTLHTATKPIVVWGNGIVMGGGLGLLGGCSHRIGTPSTRIAMPEITIGLFPDAGGTTLLSNLPDHLGTFMGLTGCQLAAGDALALDLLDIVVDPGHKNAIFEALGAVEWLADDADNAQIVSELLTPFTFGDELPTTLLAHRDEIRELMESGYATDDFFSGFESGLNMLLATEGSEEEQPDFEWLNTALETFHSGSAVTARVFIEQMRRARTIAKEERSMEKMFQMELVIAYQCIRHGDFPEGVRALLIDKDRNPAWTYDSPGQVPDDLVERHFMPAWVGEHPLQF